MPGKLTPRWILFSHGSGYELLFGPTRVAAIVHGGQRSDSPAQAKHGKQPAAQPIEMMVLQMDILGADPAAKGQGLARQPGYRNYLIGKSS